MTGVLIIEDEIKTARYISSMVEGFEGFFVEGVVHSVKTAVNWLSGKKPGLIITDIQLGDGLSFEVFKQVNPKAPVIFCTAYDQYAINAFEANGIDYLLKPIDPEKLAHSLNKFKEMQQLFVPNIEYTQKLNQTLSQFSPNRKTTLLIHHRERIIPLKLYDVDYAHSENGIVTLYTKSNRYHVNHTLEELEGMLDEQQFFKVNRQFIISRTIVDGAEHYFSRRLLVRTKIGVTTDIIVSKARVQSFLVWLQQ